MSTKTKTVILLAAIFLTFLELNLITCSGHFCEFLRTGRAAGNALLTAFYPGPADVVVTASPL